MARPKVNLFPDEDKEWGGYREAVQCIHCRRWMVIDFQQSFISESGRFHHIVLFKELTWDDCRGHWYITNRSHNPNICGFSKEMKADAKQAGFKTIGAYRRWIRQMAAGNQI